MSDKLRNRYSVAIFAVCISTAMFLSGGCSSLPEDCSSLPEDGFTFDVAVDMREFAGPKYHSDKYFQGVCKSIVSQGKGAFMISPGDIDMPWHVQDTVNRIMGENYAWYPVVGNHEAENRKAMAWLRSWGKRNAYRFVNKGPVNAESTMYSFDYENAHFVVINQYYDGRSDTGTNGDISKALYRWLRRDLEKNKKAMVFVFGHEPMIAMPDVESGRIRHLNDSLNVYPKNLLRFQKLLTRHNVRAYFCGHTHNFSSAKINGLWQIDAGHARGIGDRGSASTFLQVKVVKDDVTIYVYRRQPRDEKYSLKHTIELK